jgi:hypothetical protein
VGERWLMSRTQRNPLVPGHQIVGAIVDGAMAGLPTGTRVGVSWMGGVVPSHLLPAVMRWSPRSPAFENAVLLPSTRRTWIAFPNLIMITYSGVSVGQHL